jgi:hypothetical protein
MIQPRITQDLCMKSKKLAYVGHFRNDVKVLPVFKVEVRGGRRLK